MLENELLEFVISGLEGLLNNAFSNQIHKRGTLLYLELFSSCLTKTETVL